MSHSALFYFNFGLLKDTNRSKFETKKIEMKDYLGVFSLQPSHLLGMLHWLEIVLNCVGRFSE